MEHTWLAQWGYLAVVVGTFVEGEGTLLAASVLAQQERLCWSWVVACGALGSVSWSQLWFRTGRRLGDTLLTRRPEWRARGERVQRALASWACAYLLGCRFVVGMGTAAPAIFGAAGFSPRRFLVMDALGAVIWSAVISAMGWGAGAGWLLLTRALAGA